MLPRHLLSYSNCELQIHSQVTNVDVWVSVLMDAVLQCKEGVSGLRDSDECLKYQVAGSLVMCECS